MHPTTSPDTGTNLATLTGNPERIARCLTAANLASSTEPTRPHLSVVEIIATPTGTTYNATNGYLAVSIHDADTTGTGTTYLDPASVVAIRDMATAHTKAAKRDHTGDMTLTIDNHTGTMLAEIAHPAHPATVTRPAPPTVVTFPTLADIMAPRPDDDEPLPIGLNPALLATIAKIGTKLAGKNNEAPLILTHAHPHKPLRLTMTPAPSIEMTAVLMPVRI